MKFFIDTADIKEIREAAAMGLVDGVTTNPSLVAKTGRKFRDVLVEITPKVFSIPPGVWGHTTRDTSRAAGLDTRPDEAEATA